MKVYRSKSGSANILEMISDSSIHYKKKTGKDATHIMLGLNERAQVEKLMKGIGVNKLSKDRITRTDELCGLKVIYKNEKSLLECFVEMDAPTK